MDSGWVRVAVLVSLIFSVGFLMGLIVADRFPAVLEVL